MKIVQISPDRLEFRDSNTVYYFSGILLTLLGIVAAISYIESRTDPYAITLLPIGLAVLQVSRSRKTVFDKSTGLVTLMKKGLYEKSAKTHHLSDIARIQMKQQITDPGGVATTTGYHLVADFKNGEEVPLTATRFESHVYFGTSQIDVERTHGEKIAAFLGIPFDDEKKTLPAHELIHFVDRGVQETPKI